MTTNTTGGGIGTERGGVFESASLGERAAHQWLIGVLRGPRDVRRPMPMHRRDVARPSEPLRDRVTGFHGWRTVLLRGQGIPSPAVADGRVYVSGGLCSYAFHALDASTGEKIWSLRSKDNGPTPATIHHGCAVYNTESCTVEVVDLATGKHRWGHWLGITLLGQPACDGEKVYAVYPARHARRLDAGRPEPREMRHRLAAFDFGTGERIWETPVEHDVIAAPIVAGASLYLSLLDGTVRCVDTATGATCWHRAMRAISAPLVRGDDLYVVHRVDGTAGNDGGDHAGAGPYEQIVRLDAMTGADRGCFDEVSASSLGQESDAEREALFARFDSRVGFATLPVAARLDISAALIGETRLSRTWRYQGARPVIDGGILFDTTGNRLTARDPASGDVIWSWDDASAPANERAITAPLTANGRVWAGTWDGRLMSWDGATGDVRWEITTGAPVHWQPVVSNGWIYAGLEDGTVVGFATEDEMDDGWAMWGRGVA